MLLVRRLVPLLALSLSSCGGSTGDDGGVSVSGGAAGSGAAHGGSSGSGGSLSAGHGGTSQTGAGGGLSLGAGGSSGASALGAGGGENGFCGTALTGTGTIRDFTTKHPDFEGKIGDDKGIVRPDLGADGKPVYAPATTSPTTHGKMYFDEWYRDTPGVNMTFPLTIQLTKGAGDLYTYTNDEFFPIDGQGFGNEGNPHNFHFTFELHTIFRYQGGETFQFTGDDDLWTFIGGKLAIDLGGVHGAENGTVDLDAVASSLGIAKGTDVPLDLFFAERHTTKSEFRIDTTLVFTSCGSNPK